MPGPYPRPWGRADVSLIQSYIQRVWTHQAGREDTKSAMLTVASANRCHPPRDWLNGLAWDGRARLDLWLAHCFGADDTPFCRAAAAKILIAAARRVRQPGCKFDHMLILEGDQDLGKSTCLRRLAGDDWFTDSLPASIESKDMAIALQGIWIAEFAEIEQVIRTEVEVIKAFLTKPSDRFRPPYGKSDLTFPRQCVFFRHHQQHGLPARQLRQPPFLADPLLPRRCRMDHCRPRTAMGRSRRPRNRRRSALDRYRERPHRSNRRPGRASRRRRVDRSYPRIPRHNQDHHGRKRSERCPVCPRRAAGKARADARCLNPETGGVDKGGKLERRQNRSLMGTTLTTFAS